MSWTTAATGEVGCAPALGWGGVGGAWAGGPPRLTACPEPSLFACSVCEKGALLCEPGGCPQSCGWSAWSSWAPCDRSCGSGVRVRFRCVREAQKWVEGESWGKEKRVGTQRPLLLPGHPPTLLQLTGVPLVKVTRRNYRLAMPSVGQVQLSPAPFLPTPTLQTARLAGCSAVYVC